MIYGALKGVQGMQSILERETMKSSPWLSTIHGLSGLSACLYCKNCLPGLGSPNAVSIFLYKVSQSLYTVRGTVSLSVKQDVLHNFAKKHFFCLCSVSVLMLSYNSVSDIFSTFNTFLR